MIIRPYAVWLRLLGLDLGLAMPGTFVRPLKRLAVRSKGERGCSFVQEVRQDLPGWCCWSSEFLALLATACQTISRASTARSIL